MEEIDWVKVDIVTKDITQCQGRLIKYRFPVRCGDLSWEKHFKQWRVMLNGKPLIEHKAETRLHYHSNLRDLYRKVEEIALARQKALETYSFDDFLNS